jgi:hypothetical protein
MHVDLVRIHREPVAAAAELDDPSGQNSAKARHLALERVRRPRGRTLRVLASKEPVHADRTAGLEQQQRQESPLASSRHHDLLADRGPHLQRSEDAEPRGRVRIRRLCTVGRCDHGGGLGLLGANERVSGQDRVVKLVQRVARVDTQLGGKCGTGGVKGLEGFCLAPGLEMGAHEEAGEPFVERSVRRGGGQTREDLVLPAEPNHQLGVVELGSLTLGFEALPQLVEPGRVQGAEGLAMPQLQSLVERVGRLGVVGGPARVGDKSVEDVEVD